MNVALLLACLVAAVLIGQSEPLLVQVPSASELQVTDAEKRYLVSEILESEFGGAKTPVEIPLAATHIDAEWVPTLANVRFHVLGVEEHRVASYGCRPYYSFIAFRRDGELLVTGLERRTRCQSSGRVYYYRYVNGHLQRDTIRGGILGGASNHCDCDGGGATPN